jgi:CDP-diacylglycerol---glycerol-3-phosphate 3-phosphatidyltransferase
VNLPNSITVARIGASPLVALLPLMESWPARLGGFVLFVAIAVSDYYDGMLARTRNLVTDLGRLLDPLADKLFLVATFVPMYLLMRRPDILGGPDGFAEPAFVNAYPPPGLRSYPFATPLGAVGLPWWVIALVLGREVFMTAFRQLAARRGVVIGAIGPAKWKTGFQMVWVGTAYFWFFIATLAASRRWTGAPWRAFANFNGLVGVTTMSAAVALTVYSLWLYLRRYGALFLPERGRAS